MQISNIKLFNKTKKGMKNNKTYSYLAICFGAVIGSIIGMLIYKMFFWEYSIFLLIPVFAVCDIICMFFFLFLWRKKLYSKEV